MVVSDLDLSKADEAVVDIEVGYIIAACAISETLITGKATQPSYVVGTNGIDDIDLSASTHNVVLYGLGGDDVLRGGGGNDTIYGGDGKDTLHGNAGSDTIWQNAGVAGQSHFINTGFGDDEAFGCPYSDVIVYGGATTVAGPGNSMTIETEGGNDFIFLFGPKIEVLCGSGQDYVESYVNNAPWGGDTIDGQSGVDSIPISVWGDDTLISFP
jgi:hypothetical protein